MGIGFHIGRYGLGRLLFITPGSPIVGPPSTLCEEFAASRFAMADFLLDLRDFFDFPMIEAGTIQVSEPYLYDFYVIWLTWEMEEGRRGGSEAAGDRSVVVCD